MNKSLLLVLSWVSWVSREPSQITFAVRGGYMVSKMLTYVYIESVDPFENVYINKNPDQGRADYPHLLLLPPPPPPKKITTL